ncbi:MAG TPA: hypothetical protein VKB96_05890 [Gammaproteobacteria bacterium]|nr:hypothetical protein [Gammaproteobacteria bacterium]
MSFAPPYEPTVSFANEETNNVAGRSLVRTVALDTEFANVSSSITGIETNLRALQRDDNKIQDGIIEPYALSEQTRSLLAATGRALGNWAPGFAYLQNDAVEYAAIVYLCVIPHTSGISFDSGLWLPISGDGSSFASAQESAASAAESLASANDSAASALDSDASADLAAGYATTAGNAAVTAGNAATAAAASAVTAANVIASSTVAATQAEAEAGALNTKYMSPLRVAQAIAAQVVDATTAVKGRVALATAALVRTGSNALTAITPAALLSALGFSAYFQSSDQTITAGGALTIAHSLGRTPTSVELFLIPQSGINGYTAGREIPIPANMMAASTSTNRGVAISTDATNIYAKYGNDSNTFTLLTGDTGVIIAAVNSDYRLRIRVRG